MFNDSMGMAWRLRTQGGFVQSVADGVQRSNGPAGIADGLLHKVERGQGLIALLLEILVLCRVHSGAAVSDGVTGSGRQELARKQAGQHGLNICIDQQHPAGIPCWNRAHMCSRLHSMAAGH